MCFTTSTNLELKTANIDGHQYLIGWKKFTLAHKAIRPFIINSMSYKIKRVGDFLEFRERSKCAQSIETNFVDERGVKIINTSTRRLRLGMHVDLLYPYGTESIPVLIPVKHIILFGSDEDVTVDKFLVPPLKWALENLTLIPCQEVALEKLWNNFCNTKYGRKEKDVPRN